MNDEANLHEDKESENHRLAVQELRSIIDRIKRLDSEKESLQEDIKSLFAEAKGKGYDVPAIKKIIKIAKDGKIAKDKWRSEIEIIELYIDALGL